MGASNRLHVAAVTQAQSFPVDRLEPGGMRVAVIGNGDIGLSAEPTGHGAGPHQLVAELLCTELVQLAQKRERKSAILRGWCDELQQRFGIVGGDPGVGQLGAKCQGVGCGGQLAAGVHAQAFALVTTRDAAQDLGLSATGKLARRVAAGECQHGFALPLETAWSMAVLGTGRPPRINPVGQERRSADHGQ